MEIQLTENDTYGIGTIGYPQADFHTLLNLNISSSINEHGQETPLWPPPGYNFSNWPQEICVDRIKFCKLRFSIDVIIVALLCALGVIGNTVAIFVLRADNFNTTVTFLLQALAIGDNLYLVTCFFFQTIKTVSDCTKWFPGLPNMFPHMERYVWPIASIAQTSTVWLVVLVTLDRYVAICRPFDTHRLCRTSQAKKAVLVIVVLAILYNIPRFFEHQLQYLPDVCAKAMRWTIRLSRFRRNKLYFIIYKTIMYFVFRIIIPMGTLTYVNLRLILTLRSARKDHAKLTNNSPKSDSFTVVLVAVVTVFIICQIPDFILRIVVTIRAFTGISISTHYYSVLTNMMLTVNSSVNCLIYCLTGRRFRKILCRVVCRNCAGKDALKHHNLTDAQTFSEGSRRFRGRSQSRQTKSIQNESFSTRTTDVTKVSDDCRKDTLLSNV